MEYLLQNIGEKYQKLSAGIDAMENDFLHHRYIVFSKA